MFACSADDYTWLTAKWRTLEASCASDHMAAQDAFKMLVRCYSESHRAYHNLSHIAALLRHAESNRALIHSAATVGFAIWFHDAIYDTHAKDNEEKSAALAHETMRNMGAADDLIVAVECCILATQHHELLPGVPDLPLFLDLDLVILGAPEDVYRRYREAIRAEYNWVPQSVYRLGRSEVLKQFASRASLFFTQPMAERFEAQARRNLEREIRELSSF